jgi:hypothetical protein
MKLSKSFLFIPAATVVLAAGSGACGKVDGGPPVPPLQGIAFPDGVAIGEACSGDDYVAAVEGSGYAYCEDGQWAYSFSDPDNDGFVPVASYDGGTSDGGGTDDSGTDDGGDNGIYDGGITSDDGGAGGIVLEDPPAGIVFPDGLTVGEACVGDVYVVVDNGDWLVCLDGVWGYTTADPSDYGYTPYEGG